MVLETLFDYFLVLYRRLGLGFKQTLLMGCTFLFSTIAWMAYVVHKAYGPVVACALVATIFLTLYRRLCNYAGYGTPHINSPPMLKHQLYSTKNAIRVCCVSDTHTQAISQEACDRLPEADVFIHCGDATNLGTIEEFEVFNKWLGMIAERKKCFACRIVIGGNHDLVLDPVTYENNISLLKTEDRERHNGEGAKSFAFYKKNTATPALKKNYKQAVASQIFSNATHYLENETVTVTIPGKGTLTIAGTPVTEVQEAASMQAFARNDVEQTAAFQQTFANIPKGKSVDILMSHGPPKNILDKTFFGRRVGSPSLSKFLVRLIREDRAPKFMTFGHIHEGRGVIHENTVLASEVLENVPEIYSNKSMKKGVVLSQSEQDGSELLVPTTFINCASINLRHQLRPKVSAIDPGMAVMFDIVVTNNNNKKQK